MERGKIWKVYDSWRDLMDFRVHELLQEMNLEKKTERKILTRQLNVRKISTEVDQRISIDVQK